MTRDEIAERTRQTMREINATHPHMRIEEVPTLFAFEPIERAIVEAYELGRAERDTLAATVETLRAALVKLAIDGVTAGANPQKGGGMSPPLWHMDCRLCGSRWSKQQWKRPTEHPPYDSAFNAPCLLAGDPQ